MNRINDIQNKRSNEISIANDSLSLISSKKSSMNSSAFILGKLFLPLL